MVERDTLPCQNLRLHHQIAHSPFLSRLMEDLLSIIGRIWQIPVSEWLQAENDYAAIVLGVDFQLFLFPLRLSVL